MTITPKDREKPPAHPVLKASLSVQDINETLTLFWAITNYNKKNPGKDQKVYTGSGDHISKQGLLAETAFARVFDLERAYKVGQFMGHDFLLASGLKVDVKQSDIHEHGLIVEKSTDPDSPGTDLYCLVTGRENDFQVQGYVWADEILQPETLASWLPKEAYYIKRSKLRDPRHLALPIFALIVGHRIRDNGRLSSVGLTGAV